MRLTAGVLGLSEPPPANIEESIEGFSTRLFGMNPLVNWRDSEILTVCV
jgi:hypothetical protein